MSHHNLVTVAGERTFCNVYFFVWDKGSIDLWMNPDGLRWLTDNNRGTEKEQGLIKWAAALKQQTERLCIVCLHFLFTLNLTKCWLHPIGDMAFHLLRMWGNDITCSRLWYFCVLTALTQVQMLVRKLKKNIRKDHSVSVRYIIKCWGEHWAIKKMFCIQYKLQQDIVYHCGLAAWPIWTPTCKRIQVSDYNKVICKTFQGTQSRSETLMCFEISISIFTIELANMCPVCDFACGWIKYTY